MDRFLIKFIATVLVAVMAYVGIILYVHGPIKGEYWVRELLIVKRDLAQRTAGPKIVLLSGSSTLFNLDAGAITKATGRPTINFGLHAGMGLERLLSEANAAVKPGDMLILPLEQSYYSCAPTWTDWQFQNAIAWDHAYFDQLPLLRRIEIIFQSGEPDLPLSILAAWARAKIDPKRVRERLDALLPAEDILERSRSGKYRTAQFSYSGFNLDAYGTIQNNAGAFYEGEGVAITSPSGICPETKTILRDFVATMHQRDVTIAVAYAPYIKGDGTSAAWDAEDKRFRADLAQIGVDVIGNRDGAILPRSLFFNSSLHLNEDGRNAYTRRFIEDLKPLIDYP